MSTLQREPRLMLWIDGVELEGAGEKVLEMEVEERAEGAGRFTLVFDLAPFGDGQTGDWSLLDRGPFPEGTGGPALQLMSRITVGFELASDQGDQDMVSELVLDGYVTEMHPYFGPQRVEDSQLEVTGLDAGCLMHFQTITKTWSDMSDSEIATEIFEKYGFRTDVEASASLREANRAVIVQRCTDAEFLRMLARRNGFETFVELSQEPVEEAPHATGASVGHFHRPRADAAEVQPALQLFEADVPSLIEFEARWDSHTPTRMRGWRIDEVSRQIQRIDTSDPGYPRLGSITRQAQVGERLETFSFASGGREAPEGEPTVENRLEASDIHTGWTPHHAPELGAATQGAFRDADWFVRGRGIVRGERYPAIIRPRRPVRVEGAGHLLTGTWYCIGARHRWARSPDADPSAESMRIDRRYEVDVDLVRHGLGPDATENSETPAAEAAE